MIIFTYVGPRHSAATMKQLRQSAEAAMREKGMVVSASGVTAQFAIEWCEAEGVGYSVVTDGKRSGYIVEKTA